MTRTGSIDVIADIATLLATIEHLVVPATQRALGALPPIHRRSLAPSA